MPLVNSSSYRAPFWLPGGHAQTIFPALFRRVETPWRERQRLELADGDFLDLEWTGRTSSKLAILSHGLEGSSNAPYVGGMARALASAGWDVLAWNFRGCGGEANRLLRFYHSGATEDLHEVVSHAAASHPASRIDLIGFSLGGNLVLKYLGEGVWPLSAKLHAAVAFSVPCDLADSAARLSHRANRQYMARFLTGLREKITSKAAAFPGEIDLAGLEEMRTFKQFDDRYTAPLHGFRDANHYWRECSSRRFLDAIRLPSLLVNAGNDPFLGERCFPIEEAVRHAQLHLEIPSTGGHVGFPASDSSGSYWSERRAIGFLEGIGS